MVNEVSLKKAQNLRRKSMSVGMRFLAEKVSADKLDNANSMANNHPNTNEDKNKDRQ